MSYAFLTVNLLCGPVTIALLAVRCDRYPWHDINKQCSVLVSHYICEYYVLHTHI
jgi:hypothetical protein